MTHCCYLGDHQLNYSFDTVEDKLEMICNMHLIIWFESDRLLSFHHQSHLLHRRHLVVLIELGNHRLSLTVDVINLQRK